MADLATEVRDWRDTINNPDAKIRTLKQNNCIHWLAERWAEALCERGEDMREVIKIPIRPTKENVKSDIIIPTIAKAFPELERPDGTFHTSDLSTTQVDIIYEAIHRGMVERFEIDVPFPDRFNGGGSGD